jgi:sec-independent protein translocase protein TatA
MGGLSFTHLLILVIIAMIFFRPQKVGEVGKSLGKALRNFKEGLSEVDADYKEIKEPASTKDSLTDSQAKKTEEKKKTHET